MSGQSSGVAGAWNGFWFTPRPGYTLGLLRIAFGVVALIWALTLLPELFRVFGSDGVLPDYVTGDYQWSLFGWFPGDTALLIGWVALVVAALAMIAGWHSRIAALAVFILMYSFHRRADALINAGDSILVVTSLVLALSRCGAALSLDQRRRTGTFWSAQTLAPWAIRLLQVQLTLIYLVSVQAKLANKPWVEGSAASYAWRTDGRWAWLEAPAWLWDSPILVNMVSWGTLLIELGIAILVWNRRCRPWVLLAGVAMHLSMMLTMNVGYFSIAMFVLYLAFVPAETVRTLPDRLKTLARRRPAEPQPVDDAS
ncbi:HTTM domain-containing protein [Mycobacterium sp. NPDC003449]